MKQKIKDVFENYGLEIKEEQLEKFEKYYHFLKSENEKYNLTAITQADEVVYKHFLDSVLPCVEFKTNANLIDIGTGAGFPGVPIKIMRPDLKVVLLDSLQKRVNFLNETIALLDLKNVYAVHSRAEDYAKTSREKFDYATSRAVAQTNTLLEYMLPFVKIGGAAYLYKSSKLDEELKEAKNAIATLGGKQGKTLKFFIDEIEAERNILIVDKIKTTPAKYPRSKNLPKTKPIK